MNQQAVNQILKDLDEGRNDSVEMGKMPGLEGFVSFQPGGVDIVTHWSRDTRRSSNGGEYTFWSEYRINSGVLYRREAASCDFWQPEMEALNLGAMTYAELNAALKGA